MNRPGLPALDPLKGFDAAARHLSFTKAGEELFLTQSAISRQIQTLEEQLGVKLFLRQTRRLVLTPEGLALHRAVAETLDRLAEACANLRALRQRPRVNVTSAVGIASLWLLPRLASFQELEPEVDVRLSADNRVVDLEREDFDLALRYISPETAPADATLLFAEEVFPVAAPRIAAKIPASLKAEDLAKLTLLDFDDRGSAPWFTWEPWLAALGLAKARPKAVLRFNQYDQLVRAAQDGRGVALGRGPLVAKLITEKKLRPLRGPRRKVPTRAYFLLRAPGTSRPEVERYAQWLLTEAKATAEQTLQWR
ncbi:MAG: LysR family transcriptional regulator [Betaproteobacteria bacterium]|nr:LysR family transcriptional regulator [Betaproteobacteria bacterium]